MSWKQVVFFCFDINFSLKNTTTRRLLTSYFESVTYLIIILTSTFQNFWSGQTVCLSSSPESLLFLTFSIILRRPQERPVPRFTTPQSGSGEKNAHSSFTHVFPLSITTETIRVPINPPPFWGKALGIGSCREVPAQQTSTACKDMEIMEL